MDNDMEREFAEYASMARVRQAIEGAMVTHADAFGVINTLKGAMGLVKEITALGKKIDNSELVRLVGDLNLEMANANLQLAEVTNELADAKNQIRDLKEENQQLQDRLKPEFQLHRRDDDLYYSEDGAGPFCPNCYTSNSKKTLLSTNPMGLKCPDKSCGWSKLQGLGSRPLF